MNTKKHILIFIFFTIFLPPAISFAQFNNNSSISISSIPEIPGPQQSVSLTVESFSFDLNRARISWFIDGKKVLSGIGKTSIVFRTGDVGDASTVSVSVDAGGGIGVVTKTLRFNPAEVDLLWEAVDSYTPPLYKGKALASSESIVRVVALPNIVEGGKKIPAKNLVYSWKRNDKVRDLANQSGYGKNSIILKRDLLRNNELIEVAVSTLSGKTNARGSMSLAQNNPFIIFYENKPLRGVVYEKALNGKLIVENNEVTVVAEPYFFSTNKNGFTGISFDWRMNGNEIPPAENGKNNVTFKVESGASGKSLISLDVRHFSKILQSASNSLSILFGNTNNTSFGF